LNSIKRPASGCQQGGSSKGTLDAIIFYPTRTPFCDFQLDAAVTFVPHLNYRREPRVLFPLQSSLLSAMITATMTSRSEVLQHLEGFLKENLPTFLKDVKDSWQPADYLPDPRQDTFFDEVKLLREKAKDLSYDLVAVLVGDTITEEALPNYEAWFHQLDDLNRDPDNGWAQWIRAGRPRKTATATCSTATST
jgi:hypothetical protein